MEIIAELQNISEGSREEPVRGSRVLVAGRGGWEGTDSVGTSRVAELTPGEIHPDGDLAAATLDLISGGVFGLNEASRAARSSRNRPRTSRLE